MKYLFLGLWVLAFGLQMGCKDTSKSAENQQPESNLPKNIPPFDENTAFLLVQKQLAFGARNPGSAGHEACAAWIISELKSTCDSVAVETFPAKTFDGKTFQSKNIIGRINPANPHRILLCSHWDTRPFADKDSKDPDKPILGANDGASGVAVLLALLDSLKTHPTTLGIDVVFFDIEDYGATENSKYPEMSESYCLGSQYWSKNYVLNPKPQFGILLDMIGGYGATFPKEAYSQQFAPNLLQRVWGLGNDLGFSSYFTYQNGGAITDDHYYVSTAAGIPTIDIIHLTNDPNTFPSYHHTHGDDLKAVDKNSLKAVGQTLMALIADEAGRNIAQ